MKYKSILPLFALFSLLFVEINAPLHLYAADSSALPGIDASSAHTGDDGWKRQEKIEVEENKDLSMATDSATAIQQQSAGGEDLRIGKFTENDTNNWVALLLNQIIALSLVAALSFLGTICSLKMYRIPSILTLQIVSLSWAIQAIGFIVAYTIFSKKALQDFVYDRNKDKDRQLSAIKKMRDNAQKLVYMAFAELATYGALTLGLQSAVVAVIAEKLALMAAESAEKAALATMQGLITAMSAPTASLTTSCATMGACTTPGAAGMLSSSLLSLADGLLMPPAPPYIQETDDAYIAAIFTKLKTIQTSGATLLGTTIPTDANHVMMLTETTCAACAACIVAAGCAPCLLCLPVYTPIATQWGTSAPILVTATTSALAGAENLVHTRFVLATTRKFTLLDCPAALASVSYPPNSTQVPYMYAGCKTRSAPNLIDSLFSFLIPPSQAIDTEPIMMGGVGVVLGLISMAAGKLLGLAVTHWMTYAIKFFVHPLTRIIVIQALVILAVAMEKYMYDIYVNLKKRVQDYDDLIKKIKESDGGAASGTGDNLTSPGNTNRTPSPEEPRGPTLSPGSKQNPPNTGATTNGTTTGVDSNASSSLASQKSLSSDSKWLSGGMDEITPETIEKLSFEEIDGKTCLASDPKNPSGNIDQGCSCLITKSCIKVEPKGDDESYNIMGSLASDFKTVDKEFSLMTNHFANGRYKEGTKLAAGSNLRSALKRIISLKQQLLDEYNKQRKTDPSLPKMDYGPNDPEIVDFFNGFQKVFDKEGAKDKLNYKISTTNSSSGLGPMSEQVIKDSTMGDNTSNINSLKWTPPSILNVKDESSGPNPLDDMEGGEFKMPGDGQGLQQLGDNQTAQGSNKKKVKMKYNSSGIQETSESVFELISRRYMKSVKIN